MVGVAMPLLLGMIIYGTLVEPYWIQVRHVRLSNSHLSKVLGKKVVVQVSDLHLGQIGRRETAVLKRLKELRPDIVLLTGDFVQWKGSYEAAIAFLALVKADIGVWAVMGDYDYSNSRKSCLFCHDTGKWSKTKEHSARFLRNATDSIQLPEGKVVICGIDSEADDFPDLAALAAVCKEGGADIVLSHSPLLFDSLPTDQETVVLAGDTHGGQIPLPAWFFRMMGYDKNVKYDQGLFEAGKKRMFVSRGVGTSHLPLRICRRPEIAVLHFQ